MNESPQQPQSDRPTPPSPYGGTPHPSGDVPRATSYPAPGPDDTAVRPALDETAVRPPLDETSLRQQPEHTAVLGSPWESTGQLPAAAPLGAQQAATKKGRGSTIGIVVASLLLGGAAGFGGAAAFDAMDDDGSSGSTSVSGTTANVIDQGKSPAAEGSVEAVAAKVLPSVVKIDVSGNSGSGSGSGIVLSEDGRILTNNHVVEGAGSGGTLRVSFNDGTRASATILGTDPLTDTAVIQAEGVKGLTPATIGKSSNLSVGQQVVAIGAPYGLDATVTSGIVSALDRPVNVGSTGTQGNSTTYPAIQTDAAINPGNSGGPLVDMTGSVIGINSSIRTTGSGDGEAAGSIGLGFSIPMDPMMPIVEQMSQGETPTHARLGITVSDPESTAEGIGALVRTVGDHSAAAEAGLKSGDLVSKVDDHLIDSADDLVATIRTYRPGDEATLTFQRDGKEQTATLTLDSDEGSTSTANQDESQEQPGQQPGQGQQGRGGLDEFFGWGR